MPLSNPVPRPALRAQLVLEMAERDLFNSLRPHLRREKILSDPTGSMPIRRDMLKVRKSAGQ